ncbi:TetR/AcrR family transcriptional regulator [Bifidobacterium tibiigranuli]|uniref:TetR/AcrR family transcriptional regulator n=1 Tax=Bifidobacterium tibiigranuli TaxID=2172043 RepID=UPI0026EA2A6A|nr:TetR/AcrR family transcriptional regulator [Bifidobacterium tibiigranuli]MCI1650452.1 TetR/AcrR family transcriptional regulator [Bifidobacterium tibiigranuli]MCI2185978.1 TetR/AcrR family transcriptional regulator [Bifidobacterium tibiigranuli]MCI2204817.1 TetR/AcrR family transcriptional regulator [Bifidobacterium tibiigranuli]
MTSYQRREQLLMIGRSLFAAKGFEAVSVEEIAASAKVSKPIVYEHFGGKEGLYAVVVDREMRALNDALTKALADPQQHPRQLVERTALALLTYIEENTEGFQVLVRDSPSTDPAGSFNSLLGDVSMRVEEILDESFKNQHLPAKGVPYYAQMLVGMTVFTGQYWANQRKIGKEQLAAHIVNLAWYGLSRLEAKPELRFEGDKARKALQRRKAKQAKEAARHAKEPKSDVRTDAAPEHGDDADSNAEPATSATTSTTPSAATSTAPTQSGRDAAFGSDSTFDSDPGATSGFGAGTETDANAPEAAIQESDSI